jgi:glycerate kinase
MKIVLAPDSFKGSLTAGEVCQAMKTGIQRIIPTAEIVSVPMADGGEGTVSALVAATGGRILRPMVTAPLGDRVEAFFGILGDGRTAVIEMAAASGLPLVPKERLNPRITTTFGTGELIREALDAGCRKLIIGIGGSATNDGGAGMAQALGYHLLDSSGCELPPGGAALHSLAWIDGSKKDPRLGECEIVVACDVTNKLTGPQGASAVYGPQKGATPEMVLELDQALDRMDKVIARDLHISVGNIPGTGAGGGIGAGLIAFVSARLQKGIEIVIAVAGLEAKLSGAHLVITGEGRMDGQTVNGKTPIGVAKAAKKFGLPVLAVAGGLGPGIDRVYQNGIDGIISIMDQPLTLEEAVNNAASLVDKATERLLRIYLINRRI